MGQQEVYDFLEKHKGSWFSSKEIAQQLDASVGSVTTTLAKLRKQKDVSFKMSHEKKNMFFYCKH